MSDLKDEYCNDVLNTIYPSGFTGKGRPFSQYLNLAQNWEKDKDGGNKEENKEVGDHEHEDGDEDFLLGWRT